MTIRFPLLFVVFITVYLKTYAQPSPYIPDSTYGVNGIATPNTTTGAIWLHHMLGSAIQPDGKIILAGTGNFQNSLEVVRLDSAGVLDTSFNHTGFTNLVANGSSPWKFRNLCVAPSGNIMVGYYSENAGNTRFTLMCLRPNGTLNTSFGAGGKAEVGPALTGRQLLLNWIDVQPDGKTVMAGGGSDALMTHKYVLARIKVNGTPDTSFGVNGIVHCHYLLTESRHMQLYVTKVQTDGKILCAGTIPPGAAGNPDTLVLVRYKTNGTLDTGFGTDGIQKYENRLQTGAIRINTAGEIYLAGRWGQVLSPDTVYVYKFSATGTMISAFGMAGKVTVNAKFNTWNEHEQLPYNGRFELLPDGKMLVAGPSDSAATSAYRLCRLMPDGNMDTVFAPDGTITVARTTRDYCSDLQVQANGRIVLTGFYRTGEGTFDTARMLAMRFRDTSAIVVTEPPTYTRDNFFSEHRGYICPQPVTGSGYKLYYDNTSLKSEAKYTICNVAGQQVQKGTFQMQEGAGSVSFQLPEEIGNGLYLLHVSSAAETMTYKMLIQR